MFFRGKYAFLSNYYEVNIIITYEKKKYYFTDVETAFQAMKNPKYIKRFTELKNSPNEAKKLGKTVPMDTDMLNDWKNERRFVTMASLLHIKFQNESLMKKLLNTNDEEIVEDNTWNDCIWGKCNGKGFNALGKLLMKIRENNNEPKELLEYALTLSKEYQKYEKGI
jgi:ribA/ribD-fused uncharacterized protein